MLKKHFFHLTSETKAFSKFITIKVMMFNNGHASELVHKKTRLQTRLS